MSTVCDKSLYDSKILEAINQVKNISKKKPTKQIIHKYLLKHELILEKVLLQVLLNYQVEGYNLLNNHVEGNNLLNNQVEGNNLLNNQVEGNNLEIYESNSNEICYNVKKNTDFIKDKDIDADKESLTAGKPISFHSDCPRKKSTKKISDIRELSIDNKMDSLHKKDTRYDNFRICYQLNLQQKEYIKFHNITIDHLRGELESKQKVRENLLDT